MLTKGVNKLFSNILYKITGDKSLSFDIGTTVYSSYSLDPGTGVSSNSAKFDRTRVNLKLAKSFFDNKVIVTFGSDFDFNNGGSSAIQNGNFQWLPDLNVELILSKDRKLRAIIFNKNSLDINAGIYGRRNRQGVSISYRKDFEKLFGNRQEDIQFKVPADTTTRKGQ
ncbi:MAG: hypothetical protein NVSMB63_17070 [Sediminibacterium sp.]